MIFSSCNHYVGDREYIEYLDLYIEYEQCESYVSFKFKNKGDEEESTIKFYDLKKLPSIDSGCGYHILNSDSIEIYSYGGIPQLKLIHSLEKMKY